VWRLCSLSSTAARPLVGEDQLSRAIQIVQHRALEALRLARAGVVEPDLRLAQRLLDWLTRTWPEPNVSLPDVYQRGLNAIGDKKTAARTISILEDHGWLERVPGGGMVVGVARREVWAIHGKDAAT
jgi:hypothetical protein